MGTEGLKTPVLALVGPTASGKSAIALHLAESTGAVIVSADSMQVYRDMNIGTAKPTFEERRRVAHFMLDVAEPTEDFSVAEYTRLADAILAEHVAAGIPVIVCGGTGYYVQALIDGICESPPGDPGFRARMEEEAGKIGADALHARLAEVDPEAAESIHPNNVRRTIRALEVYHLTGKTITEYRQEQEPSPWRDRTLFLGFRRSWEDLDRRIETRVRRMLDEGLVDEVNRLMTEGCTRESTALQAIGYKELVDHFRGALTLEEAAERIALATRQFARRQMTWWRRDDRVQWLLLEKDEDPARTAGRVREAWET
jgi:tRNA dimethylallyltransferase